MVPDSGIRKKFAKSSLKNQTVEYRQFLNISLSGTIFTPFLFSPKMSIHIFKQVFKIFFFKIIFFFIIFKIFFLVFTMFNSKSRI